ncbi:MAG: hypothetical protein AAF655_23205 [Bacteroidota bacterium]
MDLKRLPFLPLHFFYQRFTPSFKRIFLVIFFLLLICGIGTLIVYDNPYLLSLTVQEIAETEEEQLTLIEIEENFRSVPVDFGVFKQWITFSAGPILPHTAPLIFFLIFQWIGWTLLLAIGTQIKSRWFFLIYGLFAFFIHFSGVGTLIIPQDPYLLFELVVVGSFLGLAYVFQMSILRWSFLSRWLCFIGLSTIYLIIAYVRAGAESFFSIPSSLFLYLAALSVIFLLFIAKEPTNLILFGATNRRNISSRLSPGLIFLTMFILFITEFFWVHEVMDFGWFEGSELFIRPVYFVVPSLILTIFLSQNHYQQVRHIFTTNTVFTFFLACFSLIIMSFMMYFFASGDAVFLNFIERWASISFLAVGLAHMFYVFTNFLPLLQRRVHVYYLLAGGKKFSFAVIWLIALSALVIAEGYQSWKIPRYILHGISVAKGDVHFRKQEVEDAAASYRVSTFAVKTSTKANYNLAALALAQGEKVPEIIPYYQTANAYEAFPYAYVNAANLLWVNGYQSNAVNLLRKAKSKHPHIYTNLGRFYTYKQQPDSAILAYKNALQLDLTLGPTYANLAHVYEREGKQETADEFYEAAIEVSPENTSVQINALYHDLIRGNPLLRIKSDTTQPYLLHNLALAALRSSDKEEAFTLLSQSADESLSLESVLLKAWLEFEADSLDKSLSRFSFHTESYPRDAAPAFLKLGHLYFKHGNPEMAKVFYQQAGEAGDSYGSFMEALMMLDTRQPDSAYTKLIALRSEATELFEPISKELGMLLKAYSQGDETYAALEWDLSTLSLEERIRVSLYADSVDRFSTALNNFRDILEEDYGYPIPYVEMSKIYQHYDNAEAETVLLNGIESTQSNPSLLLQLASVYASQKKETKADSLLQLLPDSLENKKQYIHIQAYLALSEGDTSAAYNLLESVYQTHPLDKETIILMADILHAQQDIGRGISLIDQAITYNTQVPAYWYYYGLFAKQYGMAEEVTYAREQVISLSQNPQLIAKAEADLYIEIAE